MTEAEILPFVRLTRWYSRIETVFGNVFESLKSNVDPLKYSYKILTVSWHLNVGHFKYNVKIISV